MSSSKSRQKQREWKPKMKDGSRKATVSDSGSSHAAQMAMANLKDISRRRDRGQDIDEAYLAKVNKEIDPTGAARRENEAAFGGTSRRLDGKTLGIVGGLLACCVFGYVLWSHKSLSGTLTLDRKPLPNADVHLHAAGSSAVVTRLQTGTNGRFKASWIPAGNYKITVHTPADAKTKVPAIYTKPESTLLRLTVDTNAEDIWLHMFEQKTHHTAAARNRR